MPTYAFKCSCGSAKEVYFQTLPSEAKQKHATCDACDGRMDRDIASEGFYAQGGTNFDVQKSAAFAMNKVDTGGQLTPVFRDENGKIHEVKSSKDVDRWTKDNQLGVPRMVEWTNRITGKKSYVPQRTVMKADPVTGEPADAGEVIRSSERMVPLDSKEPPMREVDAFGNRMVNGVRKTKLKDLKTTYVDPSTGKPFTFGGMWTGGGEGPGGFAGGAKARSALNE